MSTHLPLRIVVVDDLPLVANATAGVLRNAGYEVEVHCDPVAALAATVDGHVDLWVVDYQMPGLSGAELVERVRARDRRRHAPAVLVTGAPGLVRPSERDAFDAILAKPFAAAQLLEAVGRCSGDADRPASRAHEAGSPRARLIGDTG